MTQKETKSESISIRISPSFLAQIQIRAQENGQTKADIINDAVADYLKKQQWVPVTIRREIMTQNVVKKLYNLHNSIKNTSNLSEIEVEINKISQILGEKTLFTADNSIGSGIIGDIQDVLEDIRELDNSLYVKCIKILEKKGNKALVNSRIVL